MVRDLQGEGKACNATADHEVVALMDARIDRRTSSEATPFIGEPKILATLQNGFVAIFVPLQNCCHQFDNKGRQLMT